MPSANIIERLTGAGSPGQGSLVIPAFSPSGTGATVVTNQAGNPAILTVGGTQYLNALGAAAASYGCNLDGFRFRVRLVYKFTTTGASNLTIGFQLGNSATASSNTTIANSGSAKQSDTVSGHGWCEAELLWSSVLAKLSGRYEGYHAGTADAYVSPAICLNSPPYAAAAQSNLLFVPVITASGSTNSTLLITEFVAETV